MRTAAVFVVAWLRPCAGAEKLPSACAKCGKPDVWSANCCSAGGAWEGLCDKGSAQQHTWAEGYTACIGAAAPELETEGLQEESAVEMVPEKKCTDATGEPVWCQGATPSDASDTVAKTDAESTRAAADDRRAADRRAAEDRRAAAKREHDARRAGQGASKTHRTTVPELSLIHI